MTTESLEAVMPKWLRRVRGAVGMGLTWAVGWAVGGLLIGVASLLLPGLPWSAFFEVFDAPLPALAIPGFFAGVFFSIVLGVAARHYRFRDLSLPRVAAWGAVGGLLLTLFPFALAAVGLASREGSGIGTGQILAAITVPFVLLSAVSATVTLLVARASERKEAGELGRGAGDGDLTDADAHDLIGPGAASIHERRPARSGETARPLE